MITFFRRLFSSKLGLFLAMLFVGLIALAFAMADINAPGGIFAGNGETVARAGDQELDEDTLRQLATRAMQNAREEQPGLDMAAFIAAGGVDQTIEQYMQGEAVRAFAADLDLLIGQSLVNARIREIPAFQGLTGEFDETIFRQVIGQQGLSEEELRRDIERQTLIGLVVSPVSAGAQVPLSEARPYARLLLEERAGQVAAVPAAAMPTGEEPTAAEINTFYQQNIDRYTLPERRSVRYAMFTLDQLNVPAPTEEQIRAYYSENSDRYGGSETRSVQQIILPTEADAQAFNDAVDGGSDFLSEAAERGFSQTSVTISGRSEDALGRETSEEIAAAAFAADEGALLEPIRSGLGWHVIRVVDVVQRNATPLGAVRPEIVQALNEEAANEALAQLYLDIENAIDAGATFDEVVEDKGLATETTPLLAPNGLAPSQPAYRPSTDLQPILELAFTMSAEEDPELVPVEQDRRYALVDVTEVAQSAPQPLNSIRPIVTRDFLRDRANRQAQQIAYDIAERVNGGMSLRESLAQAGVTLPPPQPAQATRRAIVQAGGNVPEPVRLLFRMAEDTAKLVRLPQDQGWFVVVLESIVSNADQLTEQMVQATQQQFAPVTAEEYAEQFVNAILVDYPIERNEEAIAEATERLRSGRVR